MVKSTTAAEPSDPRIATLYRSVDRSFRGPAWHGPTLRSSLRGVTLEQAAFRPGAERHNIWELAVHAAYWKYRVCALISDLPRGSFELKGSNFYERPLERTQTAWVRDLELLEAWHDRLVAAVGAFSPDRLGEPVGNGRFTFEALIDGAAAHDVYHAGQIQLLKKLSEQETASG